MKYIEFSCFWLILGFLLLIFELIGIDFLFWSGLSSILTGLFSYFFFFLFIDQLLFFCFLNFLLSFIWWKLLKSNKQKNLNNFINQKKFQLLGYQTILSEDLVNNSGRLLIGDCIWPVKSKYNLSKGTLIEVFDIEGITLKIRPYSSI